jgi:hypothetical protein
MLTPMAHWNLHYVTNVMLLTLQLSTFLFLCSNIPFSPADRVYISQIIRYTKACFAYEKLFKARQTTDKKVDVTAL